MGDIDGNVGEPLDVAGCRLDHDNDVEDDGVVADSGQRCTENVARRATLAVSDLEAACPSDG